MIEAFRILELPEAVQSADNSILLVTPVWNDSARLEPFGQDLAAALSKSSLSVDWIIVDDGSDKHEKQRLDELQKHYSETYSNVSVMHLDKRTRKGGAIYQAWEINTNAQWLAFVDADGAISADTTLDLLHRAISGDLNTCWLGVRSNQPGTPVSRPLFRRVAFQVFVAVMRRMTGLSCKDTQCGLKIVPARSYRAIAGQLNEKGFIFDVELLLVLSQHGCTLQEVSIPWQEKAGGKIKPMREAWAMLGGLSRIRKRLKRGAYSRNM